MQLAIIGGGPAGLSAAIRAKEEGLTNVLVIERGEKLGGILNQCIHHGFGVHIFKEELTGPEYAQRLINRAVELGVNFAMGAMVIDIDRDRNITYVSEQGLVTAKAGAIILAMGCRERARGALAIPGDRGVRVYAAGVAQEMVNMKGYLPGKHAVILGSGDIGLIMARRMTLEGATVEGVYEIMPHPGGLKRNIVQCLQDYNIPLHLRHTVTRTVGQKRLEGVYVAQVDENRQPISQTERFVPCDTLLLSVGLIPENELTKKIGVELSPITGGAYVNNRLETSIPGVFACGNVLHVHDLVDHVTEEAYNAAKNAAAFIKNEPISSSTPIPVKAQSGVRYTVPTALIPGEKTYTISFRSDKIYTPARIKIQADGKDIKTANKRIIIPSEMEQISFTLETSVNEITVTVQ
ncbi:MAG: NAD(P)/FAD-dependent oxidoreductase [Defluviitaleaceae bacterium]|nr:NAD(P)/FAD-dependent oxidoreductase [Defluviitaleaceae bacterium]